MNSGYKRRRLLTAGLAALAVGGGVAASAPYSSAATATGLPGCDTINVIEPTVRIYTNEPIPDATNPPVGAMAVYLDPLQDASGATIGDSAGHLDILAKRASDGHIIESISETLQLSDGALTSTGTFDRTAILSGAWVEAPIEGVSGAYAGRHGVWRWRMTSHVAPWPVQEQIVLCGLDEGAGS